jgi:hypothetical protein
LAAALRLSQRGYQVTLYEDKPFLGGNAASHDHVYNEVEDYVYHDVYPHMYSNFYLNFWDIVQNDLGLRRDESPSSDFAPRNSFKFLRRGEKQYRELKNAGSLTALWGNLFSGVAPPLDIYLWMYSMLDMLAHQFHERGVLSLSVNGFVRSRPCATERVAWFHDFIVMLIWSVHASGTSVSSYRNFFLQAFGNVSPLLWLLKGSLQEKVMGPLEKKLGDLGCKIYKQTRVEQIRVDGGRVSGMQVVGTDFEAHHHDVMPKGTSRPADPFDYLVLAVPPAPLGRLAGLGEQGHRLVDLIPVLAETRRLHSEPIAVLDVYFKRKLKSIPPENVLMTDSDVDLSVIDISQLWPDQKMKEVTALTLGASDYWALPSDNSEENGYAMISKLHDYVPEFNPGAYWGDPDPLCDIDWQRSHYQSNEDDVIFINQVGSWDWRPETHYSEIPNLFLAGDFCRNTIDMATAEAAVTSGLNAAIALQQQEPRGEPIAFLQPKTYPDSMLRAMKLVMAPSAYAAKWCTTAADAAAAASAGNAAEVATDLVFMMKLPYVCAADWLETAGALWEYVFLGRRR